MGNKELHTASAVEVTFNKVLFIFKRANNRMCNKGYCGSYYKREPSWSSFFFERGWSHSLKSELIQPPLGTPQVSDMALDLC